MKFWPARRSSRGDRARQAHAVRTVMYASSPLLASKTPPWRSKFLVACIGLGFCVMVGRALYIQVIGTDFYQRQGESRYARTLELPANRGRIIDRNGLILASSVPAPSIWAIPKDLEATPAQRRQLAKLLGMSVADLDKRLKDNPNFVWLKRQVDEEVGEKVKALGLKGVHQVKEYKRKYPEGEAVAHVVGFTNVEDRGQEGIELAFQEELAGRNGTRRVIKDRLGRIVEDIGESVSPVDGQDIELSIDSKVQFFAYQRIRDAVAEHKAKAGSVVVLDVQTGEVLALANYPSYTPGDRRNLTGAQLRNRALTDTFEPGSTMKPFIAALALETGRVRPHTVIDTSPGWMVVTGATIRDSHRYDALTVEQVIQKSSNIGVVKMAMQMPAREMWEMFTEIGIGQRPQLRFPGVVTGRLRPYKTWRPIEQATMSYGYGLSASLFQLAQAYTVFARDGELIPASLVKNPEPVSGIRVFSPQTARAVRKMLQMAAGPGGTAPKAQTLGYSVGGKTGTARKQEGKGYADRKYRSWFVGIAPIEQPRIVVAVMVDEPSNGKFYGGDVAAPVFSEVVQQTLRMMGVPPDMDVQPQIVARQAEAVEESF
ncbi:penicillin-binding protein 2 [Caldimonas thermodepolymerans]|jgi:cell division protein FtsI (penicillin-binding protein 3)|uniref:Peptidoglycan D,D-transpeptidase FtsI n=1 Tax=Caldimonas thermodepolymerans TaxID=215580 RepID=A0A2S5T0N1_9BURK|nr:cell division protein [Caldimonas thermodepolymerans]QPC30877.1 penicillin-binding protein 2 [Caldimonas thermodepolymerans]RDH97122.1 peptidoglycan synthetase FtsI [Caldimonas thermodepolymerans]TCP08976.1 peptidoglycan synthetase FtsI [Caldimonas thermodepolymerans]